MLLWAQSAAGAAGAAGLCGEPSPFPGTAPGRMGRKAASAHAAALVASIGAPGSWCHQKYCG